MVQPLIITLAITFGFISTANAATIYSEANDGELSDDNLAPTVIPLAGLGSNIVEGSTTNTPLDRDFWSLTIEQGQALSAITLESYLNTDDMGASQSFFAISNGSQINSIMDDSDLLGSALIDATDIGQSVLDDLGEASPGGLPGGTGFVGSLGPGTYTFWAQETAGDTTYELNFQITAVPESQPLTIVGTGLILALGIASKHKSLKIQKK